MMAEDEGEKSVLIISYDCREKMIIASFFHYQNLLITDRNTFFIDDSIIYKELCHSHLENEGS